MLKEWPNTKSPVAIVDSEIEGFYEIKTQVHIILMYFHTFLLAAGIYACSK